MKEKDIESVAATVVAGGLIGCIAIVILMVLVVLITLAEGLALLFMVNTVFGTTIVYNLLNVIYAAGMAWIAAFIGSIVAKLFKAVLSSIEM